MPRLRVLELSVYAWTAVLLGVAAARTPGSRSPTRPLGPDSRSHAALAASRQKTRPPFTAAAVHGPLVARQLLHAAFRAVRLPSRRALEPARSTRALGFAPAREEGAARPWNDGYRDSDQSGV